MIYIMMLYGAYWCVVALWTSANPRRLSIYGQHLRYHVLVAGAAVMLMPFYWMLITSFKDAGAAMEYPPSWWPAKFHWENYRQAWEMPEVGFGRYYWVSIYTTLLVSAGTLFSSVLAAYAFARMNFWGKNVVFFLLLATLMVPGQVLLIPNYIILARLQWLDTYKALVVPWLSSVFSIFLLRQFFKALPDELFDAARMDGAGHWGMLWRVAVPLSVPVIITTGLFVFINTWNSLLWPLVVTSRPEMRTLMVGLQVFTTEAGGEINLLMAASTFCILPILMVFLLLQRYLVEGIARSGIK